MLSPDVGLPRGRFCSLDEAMTEFQRVRHRTSAWVDNRSADPKSLVTDHPIIPVPVNRYEILSSSRCTPPDTLVKWISFEPHTRICSDSSTGSRTEDGAPLEPSRRRSRL